MIFQYYGYKSRNPKYTNQNFLKKMGFFSIEKVENDIRL